MNPDEDPATEAVASTPVSRYAIPLVELEDAAHVPEEVRVVEIPAQSPGRAPGDDDLGRRQRDALRAGG